MRDIKFRVWHADYKKMELPEKQLSEDVDYWDGVKGSVLGIINSYLGYNADRVFMQFTGLKDSEGREIYEGDVVQWIIYNDYEGTEHIQKGSVFYHEKEARWRIRQCPEFEIWRFGDEIKVLGNIYETPELLKQS